MATNQNLPQPTPAQRVLGTYETLELILLNISPRDIARQQTVDRSWRGIVLRSFKVDRQAFRLASGPFLTPLTEAFPEPGPVYSSAHEIKLSPVVKVYQIDHIDRAQRDFNHTIPANLPVARVIVRAEKQFGSPLSIPFSPAECEIKVNIQLPALSIFDEAPIWIGWPVTKPAVQAIMIWHDTWVYNPKGVTFADMLYVWWRLGQQSNDLAFGRPCEGMFRLYEETDDQEIERLVEACERAERRRMTFGGINWECECLDLCKDE